MGSRIFRDTAVNIQPAASQPTLPLVRKVGGAVDLPLLLVMIALLVFGLLMVFSASWDFSLAVYGEPMRMFNRQVLWLALGLVVAYVLSRVDYHHWRVLAVPTMLGTIGLLAVVLFVNEIRLGAVRTLMGGSIQPSELAKVVTIIYLAVWMHSKREQLHDIQWGLIPLAVILGMVGGLIYIQPDLSATATVFVLGGLLFFLAGGDLRQIAFLLVMAIITGILVVQVSSTGQERVAAYLEGLKDPTQASYHVRRSFEAIVKGGWFGVGIGRANTKLTGLPVPPTDSIFAVIAEELGIFGALGTVALYVLLVWRGLRIAEKAPDMLGSLLAAGLTFWLALEAAINMLVMVGLMPFAGNALPFISAGGSNMVASLAAIGILMNVSRQAESGSEREEWRNFGATLDLRRRNRRRSLSRIGRA
ncbi:MAG: putative lipid II flippase FtsW [Anaerolineales bacterium]|nr:putative lipid II flippase FtsW [Anaerolineales bacterium]MCX7754969.1 putative lipid II flippase FtsW [Anaerolineales bacterium]MDW8277347.1 putative peptidoglycan glycosyltransferase FtsW [Anaerolineales bacterium]